MYLKEDALVDKPKLQRYLVFFLYFWFLAVIYLIFVSFLPFSVTNNVFVDGVNWLGLVEGLDAGEFKTEDIRSSWLLFFLYSLCYSFGGLYLIFLLNFISLVYSYSLLKISLLSVFIFLPFYFINLILPSKDILVLLSLSLYFVAIIKNKLFLALVIAVLTVFIRDAQGVFLILMILTLLPFIKKYPRHFIILAVLLSYLISLYLIELLNLSGLFMLERTISYFQVSQLEILGYPVRIFANITNLASRAVFISEQGALSLTGITLFLSGVGIVTAFLISFRTVFLVSDNNKENLFVSILFLYALILFSLSPLIQPRYIIPFAFLVLSVFSFSPSNRIRILYIFVFSVFFTISLRLFYLFSDIGLPKVINFWYSF